LAEQRRQRGAARLNRVCSARYKLDLALEAIKAGIHAVSREKKSDLVRYPG
jgi:hypothetical protein